MNSGNWTQFEANQTLPKMVRDDKIEGAETSIAEFFKKFDCSLFQVTLNYGYDLDSCPKWYKELWLQNQVKNEKR